MGQQETRFRTIKKVTKPLIACNFEALDSVSVSGKRRKVNVLIPMMQRSGLDDKRRPKRPHLKTRRCLAEGCY